MSELVPPEPPRAPLAFDEASGRATRAKAGGSSTTGRALENRELIGQTIGGRYRVHGVLGEGGMGTVFDAEHLGLARQVAIKVLSPSQARKRVAIKRFHQEARAAGGIGHPNICEVYDLGVLDDGSPYLVMEKLVGQTLAERIAKEGGLPPEDVVDVISQVLSGLVAAHDKGILHRDIKPENIFLARRIGSPPIVKLLDFGVSKMMPEYQTGEESLDLTRTGMVMGTPYYMSPEQARGERNLDGRVDVYACGVVMYEALAGRRPFLAPNYNALLLAIISTTPPTLRELRATVPPALEAIVQRAMAKDRRERYPSAGAFLQDLKAAMSADGPRVPPPPTKEERERAQVLGGRARAASPRVGGVEPLARGDGPGARLRSRMIDRPGDESTRVDVRTSAPPPRGGAARRDVPVPPLAGSALEGDESLDIPIHFTMDEAPVFDDPTEVIEPSYEPGAEAPPPLRPGSAPAEEWDGETMIHEPQLPRRGVPARGPTRPLAEPRPFHPEETVKIDDPNDIELLYDESAPPRRRS